MSDRSRVRSPVDPVFTLYPTVLQLSTQPLSLPDGNSVTGALALVRAQEDRWSLQDGVPYSAKWGMDDLSHLDLGPEV